MATLGLLRDVDAPTALLEELQRTAHMVDVYIEQCQAAAPDQLAGILRALMDERRHLVSVAVAALRARVEEASQGRGVYVVEVSWPVRDARTQSVPLVVGETIDVEGDATNGE